MTRNLFGWDLPPGVTTRMIEEQQAQEALSDSFYEKMTEAAQETATRGNVGLDELALEKLCDWFMEMINNAITTSRSDTLTEDRIAREALGVDDLLKHISSFPLIDFNSGCGVKTLEEAPDDHPLWAANDWVLTVGHIRKARRMCSGGTP